MDNSNNIENYNVDSLKAPYPSTSQVDLASEDFTLSQGQSVENIKEEKVGQIRSMWDNVHKFFTTDPRRSTLLLGLVLAGCVPQNVTKDDTPIKTETPIINPKPMEGSTLEEGISSTPDKDGFYTVQPTPVIDTPIEIPTPIPTPTEIEVEKEFDYSTLNLIEWESYEVSDMEKLENGYIVHTTKPTMLYATPLFDFVFQEENTTWAGVKEMRIKDDFVFEIVGKRTITDTDGKSVTIGRVRNSFGLESEDSVISIILSAKDKNGVEIDFVEEDINTNRESCATVGEFIGMVPSSALKSVLLTSRNLLKYQEENGPFKAGQEYSFSDITQFYPNDSNSEFYPYTVSMGYGRTNNHIELFTTAMAYMLYGSSEPMVERVSNPPSSGYTFSGPDISRDKPLDYKVLLSKTEGAETTHDFVFRIKDGIPDKYIKLSIDFTDNQLPEGLNVVQEPVFVYSMCTTDKPIVRESEKFDKLYKDFLEYEKKRKSERYQRIEPENFRRYILGGEKDAKVRELINAIYEPVQWEGE